MRTKIYLYGSDEFYAQFHDYPASVSVGDRIICSDSADGLRMTVIVREIYHDPENLVRILWTEKQHDIPNRR